MVLPASGLGPSGATDALVTTPARPSCSIVLSPRCSMSIARRDPKWRSRSLSWAGQALLVHRQYASPAARAVTPPQAGHVDGNVNGWVSDGRLASTTWTT